MLLRNKIVFKNLRSFEEVKEYIDEYDYELMYSLYEKLVKKEFYIFEIDGEKMYVPVETVSSLIEEYNYILPECEDIEEFLEEVDCIMFEDYLLKIIN